jgi:hypothetical protein
VDNEAMKNLAQHPLQHKTQPTQSTKAHEDMQVMLEPAPEDVASPVLGEAPGEQSVLLPLLPAPFDMLHMVWQCA